MKKIIVVIPAYNEGKNIKEVLDDIKKQGFPLDILVVNDGSRDNTAKVARAHNALVLDLPTNLGIGGARQAGLIYAEENGYNLCIQMDADGQHPASNIRNLIEGINQREIVIGSRFIKNGYRGATTRRLGMILLSGFLRLVTGQKITDPTSGLRAFRRPCIIFLARHYPIDYPEVEPLVFLHWAGFKTREVPAIMKLRRTGKSSITPFYYMVKVVLSILINIVREKPKWSWVQEDRRIKKG